MVDDGWVPATCTLPTMEQPVRRAQFDDLFTQDVISVEQPAAGILRLELRAVPDVAARAAGLAARETACCSFFTFNLTITEGKIGMVVSTEPEHEPVLAALAASASSRVGRVS